MQRRQAAPARRRRQWGHQAVRSVEVRHCMCLLSPSHGTLSYHSSCCPPLTTQVCGKLTLKVANKHGRGRALSLIKGPVGLPGLVSFAPMYLWRACVSAPGLTNPVHTGLGLADCQAHDFSRSLPRTHHPRLGRLHLFLRRKEHTATLTSVLLPYSLRALCKKKLTCKAAQEALSQCGSLDLPPCSPDSASLRSACRETPSG